MSECGKADTGMDLRHSRWAAELALVAMGVVAFSNLLLPQSYAIFGWDYVSYFPRSVQIGWWLICSSLVFAWGRIERRVDADGSRWLRWLPVLLTAVLLAGVCESFYVLRTPYPEIAGDGEFGPDLSNRLRAHMTRIANAVIWGGADSYSACAWVQIGTGTVCVVACGVFLLSLRVDWWIKLGIAGLMVFTAQGLSAHGHYDGYAVSLLTQALWWFGLAHFDRQVSVRGRLMAGLLWLTALGLAVWSSPILLILVVLMLFYLVYSGLVRSGSSFLGSWLLLRLLPIASAGAVAVAALVKFPWYLVEPDFRRGYLPVRGDYLLWFAHSCSVSFLCVALPAVVLLVWVVFVCSGRTVRSPAAATAVMAVCCSLFCRVTLPFRQGVNDEFVIAVLGTMALGGTLVLLFCCVPRRSMRSVVCFAILAMYLHVPKVFVYGSDRYLERCRALFPEDRCPHNNVMSPYAHLGYILPSYTDALVDLRMEVFAQGATSDVEYWEKFRAFNLFCYTIVAVEYGRYERAEQGLGLLVRDSPRMIWRLLAYDSSRFGARGKRFVRRVLKELLAEAYGRTGRQIYVALLDYISSMERGVRRAVSEQTL